MSKHLVLAVTNEFNPDSNQNHSCVGGFSRNISTVVSIACKGQGCKCRFFTPLIVIDVQVYIYFSMVEVGDASL